MVDVERHGDLTVGRGAIDTGYAVVFVVVNGRDVERLFENLGVGHDLRLRENDRRGILEILVA